MDQMGAEAKSTGSGLRIYRLTARQFETMIDAGVFPEGAHVELLGGLLVEMVKDEPHNYAVGQVADLLRPLVPTGRHVREEKPARLGRFWRPEPDVGVVRGRRAEYRARPPALRDCALV